MHLNVTLKAEDFKNMHNAKCKLFQLISALGENKTYATAASKNLVKELTKIQGEWSKSMKDVYAQEDKDSNARYTHFAAVAKDNGLSATWSMLEVADLMLPHSFKDVRKVVHKNHWGKTAVAVEVEGDRWVDLYVAADKAIKLSGDTHHSFIEGFGTKDVAKGNLLLHTGS